ncbi:hypothetical protein ACI78V_02370 [Geodermatophilus sp. SYSU D00742]
MGPYQLFSRRDWSRFPDPLAALEGKATNVVLVAAPLHEVLQSRLEVAFPDRLALFQGHLVRDLTAEAPLPPHDRRQLRRAGRSVDVEVLLVPLRHLDDWVTLCSGLVARHRLGGIHGSPRESLKRKLQLRGMVALRADRGGAIVAMTLWLVDWERAHHLGASSDAGRQVSACCASFAAGLEGLGDDGVRFVDFGGVAGAGHKEDGLSRFKSGWPTEERPAYLWGLVFDETSYATLTAATRASGEWFPAYRAADRNVAVSAQGAGE